MRTTWCESFSILLLPINPCACGRSSRALLVSRLNCESAMPTMRKSSTKRRNPLDACSTAASFFAAFSTCANWM